jgi:hypothetical protein
MLWEDGALLLRDRWRWPDRPRSPPSALEVEFWARADAIGRWLEEGRNDMTSGPAADAPWRCEREGELK